MKYSHAAALTALALLLALGGCGGGGGDAVETPDAPGGGSTQETTTYGTTNLPGRLLVADTSTPARVFDLRTGQGTVVPSTASDSKTWSSSTVSPYLARVSGGAAGQPTLVERIRASDLRPHGSVASIPGSFNFPKVSPDGRFILTFWAPDDGDPYARRLSVFDAETGAKIKEGSRLDGQIVISSPAAWLPDGRYIYLVGRDLYVSDPASTQSTLVATLALPSNGVFDDGSFLSGGTFMSVSPLGTHIAFDWRVPRQFSDGDQHIFVAGTDGSDLHQVTAPPDPNSSLRYVFNNPTWSPDGKWVAAVLYMQGGTVAPIFPPDQSFPGVPGGVIGTTGCATNPTVVFPMDARSVAISWPTFDSTYGLKVRSADGQAGQWVSTCGTAHWLP